MQKVGLSPSPQVHFIARKICWATGRHDGRDPSVGIRKSILTVRVVTRESTLSQVPRLDLLRRVASSPRVVSSRCVLASRPRVASSRRVANDTFLGYT
eukprot:scaffold52669_cov58-Attheya_sp.AAC.1